MWKSGAIGTFNQKGDWMPVTVEQIRTERTWGEPFDIDEFLTDPNPKLFDPDNLSSRPVSLSTWMSSCSTIY